MSLHRHPHPVSALTIGVFVSLAVHGGFVAYSAFVHIPEVAWQGPRRPNVANRERAVTVVLLPPKPPEPPKPKPSLQEYPDIGEKTGTGTGSHASEGPTPLQ